MSKMSQFFKNVKISQRPLDIIYVIDTSDSMSGVKIDTVNRAMKDLEELLRNEARKNPAAQVNIRIIRFGGEQAQWHLQQRTPVENYKAKEIWTVPGRTPFGSAIELLSKSLESSDMPERGLRPIIVVMSDGWPTDEWKTKLERFHNIPWAKKAGKVAIAIGEGADKEILGQFTQDPSLVLAPTHTADLRSFIQWTSTLVTHNSTPKGGDDGIIQRITPPTPNTVVKDDSTNVI